MAARVFAMCSGYYVAAVAGKVHEIHAAGPRSRQMRRRDALSVDPHRMWEMAGMKGKSVV